MKSEGGLPDRARPLVMRGHPEEQPVLSRSRGEEACVSEEGQSFRDRNKETAVKGEFSFPDRTPERGNCTIRKKQHQTVSVVISEAS